MLLWIYLNFCPLTLRRVGSHLAKITIVERLTQARNNATRVWVAPKLCDQGRRNDAFTLLATHPPSDICYPPPPKNPSLQSVIGTLP